MSGGRREEKAEEEAKRARAELDRLARGPESLGSSEMARAAGETVRRLGDHFAGRDAIGAGEGGGTDPAELWGRRIGRTLSLIGVIVLGYLLGVQLRLW